MVQRRPSLWLFKKLILNLRSRQLQLRSQQLRSDFEPFSEPSHKTGLSKFENIGQPKPQDLFVLAGDWEEVCQFQKVCHDGGGR